MQMKKRLVMVAIAAAVFLGASVPASAVSVCDLEATTFEIWFAHVFLCH